MVLLQTSSSDIEKVRAYIVQYPVFKIFQSASHFTSMADLFTQTLPQIICETHSDMLCFMRENRSYTCQPLSIARFSFITQSELEPCRDKKNYSTVLLNRRTCFEHSLSNSRDRRSIYEPLRLTTIGMPTFTINFYYYYGEL